MYPAKTVVLYKVFPPEVKLALNKIGL